MEKISGIYGKYILFFYKILSLPGHYPFLPILKDPVGSFL
ncbi:hypothetical protein LEP1GSC061_0135 [Leptospira wolffii serovar Khorat str. Khorat-H2]|nr:hypothetical protein LEP1GSC061_0135 [Leptospira wolffii serovar Khorat str. Khorat-H2]